MNHSDLANLRESGVDFSTRTISLYGEIDDSFAQKAMDGLLALERAGKSVIHVRLFSGGGDIVPGFAVCDALTQAKCRTHCTVYGQAASMAVALLQSCSWRTAGPNARLYLHPCFIPIVEGVVESKVVADQVRELKLLSKQYEGLIAQRTGLSTRRVADLCARSSYLSAREALRLGFLDEVLGCA